MGQYYKPIILSSTPRITFDSYAYDNGRKLMEHSWVGNNFVNAVENFLHESMGGNIVWAGDYADDEPNEPNLYTTGGASILMDSKDFRYLYNVTKNCFVDKSKVPDVDGWKIHPLPLLTCEGNGRGGGDFRGDDPKGLVGSWARDFIYPKNEKPVDAEELIFDLKE